MTSTEPTAMQLLMFTHKQCGRLLNNAMHFRFTGLDYAMVLHAIFPEKCVSHGRLCWAHDATDFQLDGNIEEFVRAATSLGLDMPQVTVETLRPTASNIATHLRVQKWLFMIARKFPISPDYDAAAVRRSLAEKYVHVLPVACCPTSEVAYAELVAVRGKRLRLQAIMDDVGASLLSQLRDGSLDCEALLALLKVPAAAAP